MTNKTDFSINKKLKTLSLIAIIFTTLSLASCANQQSTTLYEQLGGMEKLELIANNFVNEIAFNEEIYSYFEETNIERFTEKLVEQLCVMSNGPCTYTGDSMAQVHAGMQITENHFNLTVDLFVAAMDKAEVPHRLQNQLLKEMAKTRDEMLYK
ncbi:group I truncated hemoglobin [Brumicola blandensis]|uniref:Group 1 truncated hemoglobin n=1 Tax=Brumicola blandensis TaxID=3075611 RepID=A0AAW8R568_9ALTE|nr:group 1 truncated hemoglobin [Alteromonas sp. W409]MDT0584060.1 group 1 truncated hemoglobin [Alteromonas sp. W409]